MYETDFWQLIDETRDAAEGDPDDQAEALVERLAQLTPDDVVDFARLFEARFQRAYRYDLWAAAYLMLDGASEDTFDFFRCWLIGQGREVFEGALHQPDDLAELVPDFDEEEDGEAEDLGYAADEAHEQLTGLPLPDLGTRQPRQPEGDSFDFEDAGQMAKRFPRLWELYGG
ncbi:MULTISPECIES: DUF4240 domain-containing protein [unclassified Kitasatospora]|uniref:DUF4240 domain-containing protein n=1 Tax=unclassified Kitasatospora TaxID=2633591 RepID=UPI00070F7FA8|nr:MULTISPECIES: DUF4240 domain-containing protein [unclassified Kitasatospora]KQV16795.1 polymerase [Kitasatospora sp. Root107]KRB73756.1 polymerase [Kitasatospora sp. Root187]